jgi:hypothetical protein
LDILATDYEVTSVLRVPEVIEALNVRLTLGILDTHPSAHTRSGGKAACSNSCKYNTQHACAVTPL